METLTKDFKIIMHNTWPVIICICIFAIILRIYYLSKNNRKFIFHKEISYLFCLVYVLCLFQIVTSQDVSGIHGVNTSFFKELTRYEVGTRFFYRNVIGNIFLFIPLGFFLGHIFKVDKNWLVILLTTLISLTIETVQLSIGRAFDVDDILLNVIGGIFGYLVYKFINHLIGNVKEDKRNLILIAFLLIVFIGIIVIIL